MPLIAASLLFVRLNPFPTVKVRGPLAPFVPCWALFSTEMFCDGTGQYRKFKLVWVHKGNPCSG